MIERKEELVTVFGGDGFIGRYVCEYLFRSGVRVWVASRDPRNSYFIQPLGQVGQFGFVKADITKPVAVREALKSATAAINLCGTFGKRMHATHVDGARNVAEAAVEAGVDALVHISAIGASAESPSAYGKTKAEGEALVREAFPTATLVRPSLVFGPEDALFNRFAGMARLMPIMPVVCGDTRFQPVYVGDLADAVMAASARQDAIGVVYELGGPRVWQFRELLAYILKETGRKRRLVDIPIGLARLQARFMELVPGKPLTRDQLLMLQQDNVAAADMPGLHELGIVPTPVELVVPSYLRRFRPGGGTRRVPPQEPNRGATDLSLHTKD